MRKPKKKLAIVNGIPCKNCKKVEVGHNAANCGGTAEERAAAARGVKKP